MKQTERLAATHPEKAAARAQGGVLDHSLLSDSAVLDTTEAELLAGMSLDEALALLPKTARRRRRAPLERSGRVA